MNTNSRTILRILACVAGMACLLGVCITHAEVMNVSTLYTQAITPANAVHPLWTPVQHYRGMTFVVCPDVSLRPKVTQITSNGVVTTVFLDTGSPVYTALMDGHNRFTMGIDKNGYLHIAGDMHGYAWWWDSYVARYQYQNIMYWRSNKALDVTGGFTFAGGLNTATALPGEEWGGDSRFFNDRNGELYYSSRVRAFTGGSLGGSEPFIAYGVYRYNASNGVWAALGGTVNPSDAPGATNFNKVLYWEYTGSFEAYQCRPRFDSSNKLHFVLSGNTYGTSGNGLVYATSSDGGTTWKKASGASIPGLPIRGKDGVANQGDLVGRSTSFSQQGTVCIDKNGKLGVNAGDSSWWSWGGSVWTNITVAYGGVGILGPDSMLTAEADGMLTRKAAIGLASTNFNTGFGQVFSTSELGLQTAGAIYGVSLPAGFNFNNATNMSVYKAVFTPGGGASSVPTAPTIFFAQGDNTRVWLSWTAADRATSSYNVKRATVSGGPYTIIATGVTSPGDYVDTGRANGTTYYYVVSAVNAIGESANSAQASATPVNQPLAPVIQSAVGGNQRITLNWLPLWPDTASYNVKRATVSGGPYTTIATGVTGLSYTNICLSDGTVYYYVVSASNAGAVESPDSAQTAATPFRWVPILKYASIGYDPAVQGVASASGENLPIEGAAKGFDGKANSKWLVAASTGWLQYRFTNGASWAVTRYVMVSGGDAPGRDPKDWQLQGSANGSSWITLDTRAGQTFSGRGVANTYTFSNSTAYPYYRLNITANADGYNIIQLAELGLWADDVIMAPPATGLSVATGGTASASGENPPNETAAKAFDGNSYDKWLVAASTGWLQYRFADGVTWAVTQYSLVSGNDGPGRDPKDWQLQGSANGSGWTTLDTRAGQTFSGRNLTNTYFFSNSTAYPYYRLNITANADGYNITQLSELVLWVDGAALPAPSGLAAGAVSSSRIVLSWTDIATNETGFKIERKTGAGGTYAQIATAGANQTGYQNTGLSSNTTYYYRVHSYNAKGDSAYCSEAHETTLGYNLTTGGTVSASGENPPNETAAKAFDGDSNSKWLVFASTGWLQYRFAGGVTWAVTRYTLVSGGDGPGRDPKDWQFQGSANGTSWTTLDTRTGQTFPSRRMAKTYTFSNSTAYQYYRLNITANMDGAGITQLSELVLCVNDTPEAFYLKPSPMGTVIMLR